MFTPLSFSFSLFLSSFTPLLLLVVVSTGSTANRRTFLTVVSIGAGTKRLDVGGGDDSDIVYGSVKKGKKCQCQFPFVRITQGEGHIQSRALNICGRDAKNLFERADLDRRGACDLVGKYGVLVRSWYSSSSSRAVGGRSLVAPSGGALEQDGDGDANLMDPMGAR